MKYVYVIYRGQRYIKEINDFGGCCYYTPDSFEDNKTNYFLWVNSKEYIESQCKAWFGYYNNTVR